MVIMVGTSRGDEGDGDYGDNGGDGDHEDDGDDLDHRSDGGDRDHWDDGDMGTIGMMRTMEAMGAMGTMGDDGLCMSTSSGLSPNKLIELLLCYLAMYFLSRPSLRSCQYVISGLYVHIFHLCAHRCDS